MKIITDWRPTFGHYRTLFWGVGENMANLEILRGSLIDLRPWGLPNGH